jgi:uncharacterized iron-regulated protein
MPMLTRREQRTLLRTFTNQVTTALLRRSDEWPEDWDGHDLRELALYAFEYERTALMREDRRRRRACRNEIITRNLY